VTRIQKNSKLPTLVAAQQADVRGPPVGATHRLRTAAIDITTAHYLLPRIARM